MYFQLCVDVSSDGDEILTSSKGFNSVGCEAKVSSIFRSVDSVAVVVIVAKPIAIFDPL